MRETIANALKDALKAKDACRVSTLRLIQATASNLRLYVCRRLG